MQEELMLPCCFCGDAGIGELEDYDNNQYVVPFYFGSCKCDALYRNKQDAIEQWNNRPNHWITDRLPTDEEQYNQKGSWGVLIKVKGKFGISTLSGHYDRDHPDGAMWETGGEGFPITSEVIGWMPWPK